MIAYIGSENKPENEAMYKLLHDRKVMCMISAAPVYDKLRDSNARADAYRAIFKQGADILESDEPVDVARAIEGLLPKRHVKQHFFGRSNGKQ